MDKTKELLIALGAVAIAAVIGFFWVKGSYNTMVVQEEKVKTAWSQVENQYQRRADLVPNLVNTVKAHAHHERETLQAVIEARAKATGMVMDPANLTPEALRQFQAAQGQLSGAMSRLLAVMERYPDLQSSASFRELQVQLEGTENRISVERRRFNETAREYNSTIRSFPASLLANAFGFAQRPYFAAVSGADTPPLVDFSGEKQ